MRALIQRVKKAGVTVDGRRVSQIGFGLLVFLGIGKDDTEAGEDAVVRKVADMRLFPDGERECAFSVRETGGEVLLVSQFTLYADVRKGRRPSFSEAMPADAARESYERTLRKFIDAGIPAQGGVFQVMMDVELVNDGPYTIWFDTDS